MSCPCDQPTPTSVLAIPAGLDDLPRQRFTFAELKRAMLDRAALQSALAEWRARASDDYGVLWLELWAYVGELLSLYDKAIADESYVRTAKLRPSLRRLLAVLGYVPRPAVAATVELAVLADGAAPVILPIGTGFRSGGFGSEPPQVFELTTAATIHPALNRWPVATPASTTLTGSIATLLIDPATARVAVDDVILVELSSAAADTSVRKVTAVRRVVDTTGRRVVEVTLDRPVEAGAGKPVSGARILKPTRTASLKSPAPVGADVLPAFGWFFVTYFILDGVYREPTVGTRFFATYQGETRWLTVTSRMDSQLTLVASSTTDQLTIDVPGSENVVVPPQTVPAVKAPHTTITTTDGIDDPSRKASATSPTWLGGSAPASPDGITLGLGLATAGKVLGPALAAVAPTDPLALIGARVPIGSTASTARLILRDAEQRGVAVRGAVTLATGALALDSTATWTPNLATPLTAHGNVVTAVRGETVASEILGSGDAAAIMQAFKLAKKPLTYVALAGAADDAGVAAALQVWVGGVLWAEVPSFFDQGPAAEVYVVRQDDAGASTVTFGDGVRGARLPTGVDNVVASYRWGAGAAAPPAGSIAQVAKPVPGLAAVVGPIAAGGGADAEDAESLRALAPRSALLLGRAISIDDMEVAALLTPGVITARADWGWDGVRQRPVVKVWIVGGTGVVATVAARLMALADPETPIQAAAATAITATFAIDLELDPTQVAATVLAAASDALLGDDGWLTPARLGIARPLLRSPLLARLLAVPGVTGVRGLTWNGAPLLDYGVAPGWGNYFDLTAATVTGS